MPSPLLHSPPRARRTAHRSHSCSLRLRLGLAALLCSLAPVAKAQAPLDSKSPILPALPRRSSGTVRALDQQAPLLGAASRSLAGFLSSGASGSSPDGHGGSPQIERTDAAGNITMPQEPLPVDLSLVRRVRVAGAAVDEAPLRVGNLDVLVPIADKLEGLGASTSEVALKNLPGNPNTPTGEQYFQINLYNRSPIVMAIGKSVAYVDQAEQRLRAAPLVMGNKIWLPLYSLAPLMGASCRLAPDGTLSFNPTIQSVELFQVRGTTVLTVKASAPLDPNRVLMGTMSSPPKLYLDFRGFSMGFDVTNSTNEKVLTGGLAEVAQVRGGLFEKFPDTTRVVLDLKQKVTGVSQSLPDKSLFALLLQGPSKPALPQIPTAPDGGFTSLPVPKGSLLGLTIVVDAGHGGSDNGAVGARSMEKTHTLSIARTLRDDLQARGATVLMTRDGDSFPELYSRPRFANQRKADIFISVHINDYRSSSSGTETYYYTGPSLPLAREVHAQMIQALGLPDRKVKSARFVVIRYANMPAILTETAFISNPREEALLMQPAFRAKAAHAMARGIQNYVDKYLRHTSAG